jgi:hypothetical protein
MVTPRTLRAAAARKRAEADALEAAADAMEKLSGEVGLPRGTDYAKLRRMSQPDILGEMRKSRSVGRRPTGTHALHKGLADNSMTMSELARLLNKSRNTVKSWTFQSIPAPMAKRIEELLGVPATLKYWPAGIQQ